MRYTRRIASIALATSLAHGSAASAQTDGAVDDAAPGPEAEAQRLFLEAQTAFAERRYADARRALEESLELAPRSATAINLARVLLSLGEALAADALLEGLLGTRYGPVSADRRSEARALREQAGREIASLTIAASGVGPFVVRVDGVRVTRMAVAGEHVQLVDPGTRVIVLTADDGRTDEVTVRLAPGGEKRITIDLGASVSGETEDASPGLVIGIALGIAALAAGAVVAVVFAMSSNAEPTARPDPTGVYGVVEALRF